MSRGLGRPVGRELASEDHIALDTAMYDYGVAIAEAARAKDRLEEIVALRIAPFRVGDVVEVAGPSKSTWRITEVYCHVVPMLSIFYRGRNLETGMESSSITPARLVRAAEESVQ